MQSEVIPPFFLRRGAPDPRAITQRSGPSGTPRPAPTRWLGSSPQTSRPALGSPFPASQRLVSGLSAPGWVLGIPQGAESSEAANRLFPQPCVNPGRFPRAFTKIWAEIFEHSPRHSCSKTSSRRTSSRSATTVENGPGKKTKVKTTRIAFAKARVKRLVWPKGSFRPGHGRTGFQGFRRCETVLQP